MKALFMATGLFLIGGNAWASVQPQNLSLPPPPIYQLGPNPEDLAPHPIRNDMEQSQSSTEEIPKPPIRLAPSSISSSGGGYPAEQGVLAPQAQSSMGLGFSIPMDLGGGPGSLNHGGPNGEPGAVPDNFGAAKARAN